LFDAAGRRESRQTNIVVFVVRELPVILVVSAVRPTRVSRPIT